MVYMAVHVRSGEQVAIKSLDLNEKQVNYCCWRWWQRDGYDGVGGIYLFFKFY